MALLDSSPFALQLINDAVQKRNELWNERCGCVGLSDSCAPAEMFSVSIQLAERSITQPFLHIVLPTIQWDEKALKLIGHSDGTVGMCLKFSHWYFHTLADSVERSASGPQDASGSLSG